MRSLVGAVRRHPLEATLAVALLIGSYWLRAGGLAPSSLWLDDAWVVSGVRAGSVGDLSLTLFTTPGFTLVTVGLFAAFGKASLAAQAIPFVAGVLLAPLGFILLRWVPVGSAAATGSARLGIAPAALAGVLAMVSPAHMTYSTRVKHYTLDALAVLVVMVLVLWALHRPRLVWAAAGSAALAMFVSATSIAVTGPMLAAGALASRRVDKRVGTTWLAAVSSLGVVSLIWWATYLRPTVPQAMYDYWAGAFIDTDGGLSSVAGDLAERLGLVSQSLLGGGWLAWVLVGIALTLTAVRRPAIGLVVGAALATVVALSALERLPLGANRTDIFLLPLLMLLAAVASAKVWRPAAVPVAAGLALWVLVAGYTAWKPVVYPGQDIRSLVATAEADLDAGTSIVVYPATRYAYPLYSDAPVSFARSDSEPAGFAVTIEHPSIAVLRPHRQNPQAYRPELETALDGQDEAWFIASHWRDDIDEIHAWAADAGFTSEETKSRGARLYFWSRSS